MKLALKRNIETLRESRVFVLAAGLFGVVVLTFAAATVAVGSDTAAAAAFVLLTLRL